MERIVISVVQQSEFIDMRKFVDLVIRKGYDMGQVGICLDYLERGNVEQAMLQNSAITTDLLELTSD